MQIHPLVAGAAVSIIVLSGVGVAAITGYLPGTRAVESTELKKEVAKPACTDCGVVVAVRQSDKKGEGTGVGAVVGGVAGAVLGREIADGRDAGTLLGAAGGAVAGHQIERHARTTKRFHVDVRMENGTLRTVTSDTPPAWKSGDRVRLQSGKLLARS
jgi:outer membrane lipoprotein SlyB